MELRNYRQTATGKRLPQYVQSDRCRLDIGDLSRLSNAELWAIHDTASIGSRSSKQSGSVSLLDVKIELSRRILSNCRLCDRQCGVNRLQGEVGFCGVGADSYYFFEQTLWGEEPPLVPSHEIFFSGCNLRCKFCYSWESLSDPRRGTRVEPAQLANKLTERRCEGAANLNLIGGEPTVHLQSILAALKLVEKPTPVVWNSNFYMSNDAMRLLQGVVDLYLGDFRFGNEQCAYELGRVSGYVSTAKRNFLAAQSGETIIRHLVLPGHIDCCLRPIAEWVAENLPDVPFNLMFQYAPFFEALDDSKLCRSLTPAEESEATRIVTSLGLNTSRWKRPLARGQNKKIGRGELNTTVTIRPDGRVMIMHLHSELLDIVQSLSKGELNG